MEVDVTTVDPVKLVKEVYNLSIPRGMGFLHFQSGSLSDEDAKQCIDVDGNIGMDYVRGRGCKFYTKIKNGQKYFTIPWYDHTDADTRELAKRCGFTIPSETLKHNPCCVCPECEAAKRS